MPGKPMWKQFAENVRLLRKVQGLSLQDVADRAKISKTHVWEIEQQRSKNPTIATLVAMARGLGVAPVALLGEMDTPPLHPLAMKVAVDVDRAFRDAGRDRLPDAAE